MVTSWSYWTDRRRRNRRLPYAEHLAATAGAALHLVRAEAPDQAGPA
ncbi:MAG: hypothetical protein M3Y74_04815 [Chloroflexota bacterium]|nr:hypothetical protein [Chloroflexota bacterium]